MFTTEFIIAIMIILTITFGGGFVWFYYVRTIDVGWDDRGAKSRKNKK